jgi:hypothetical protein
MTHMPMFSSDYHKMQHEIRLGQAQHNEALMSDYITRLQDVGVNAEAGSHYGSTAVVLRFDEVERLLRRLQD